MRLVTGDDWDATAAAATLRRHFADPVLRQVRARLARTASTPHGLGPIGDRAMRTISLAIGDDAQRSEAEQWGESA